MIRKHGTKLGCRKNIYGGQGERQDKMKRPVIRPGCMLISISKNGHRKRSHDGKEKRGVDGTLRVRNTTALGVALVSVGKKCCGNTGCWQGDYPRRGGILSGRDSTRVEDTSHDEKAHPKTPDNDPRRIT